MKAQEPAEGILKINEWGNSKMYTVRCTCGNTDDDIDFEVEADDLGVTVYTYTTQKTDWWVDSYEQYKSYERFKNPLLFQIDFVVRGFLNSLAHKLKITYNVWVNGYVNYSQSLIMTEQQALNYANTLNKAIKDVKEYAENEHKIKCKILEEASTR